MWRIGRAPNSIPNILLYPTRCNVTQFIYIWKLLYMFRVVLPIFIRRAYNCIYSIWYLSHRYCYLPLSWKSWNWFERAVGGVRHVRVGRWPTRTWLILTCFLPIVKAFKPVVNTFSAHGFRPVHLHQHFMRLRRRFP